MKMITKWKLSRSLQVPIKSVVYYQTRLTNFIFWGNKNFSSSIVCQIMLSHLLTLVVMLHLSTCVNEQQLEQVIFCNNSPGQDQWEIRIISSRVMLRWCEVDKIFEMKARLSKTFIFSFVDITQKQRVINSILKLISGLIPLYQF